MIEYDKLFVGGDISGIQKFIYNITSKRAAVSLKGRSAYINTHMTEIYERLKAVISGTGTTEIHDIYCSGGKFYFITENKKEIKDAIDVFAAKEQKHLWDEHMGQLSINIAYIPFAGEMDKGPYIVNGISQNKCGLLWDFISKDFAQQKNQKFKKIITDNFDSYFTPISIDESAHICAITGVESTQCVKYRLDPDESEDCQEEVYMLPSAKKCIDLGRKLRDSQKFKTFNEYAKDGYLGVLRMDVDGLGARFIKGFDSINEYLSFSNRLTHFFEEELPHYVQDNDKYSPYLNIIYAGGDDIFVVGRWDKVIELAKDIHLQTDKRFSDENIHISGGIAIVKPKYPIARAANDAGEAEDASKAFKNEILGNKNAFTIFGKTISWNTEFDIVEGFKNRFLELLDSDSISKGLLQKIMLYDEIADENKRRRERGENEDFRYVWHMTYYLTRYAERYKTANENVYHFVCHLRDNEVGNPRQLELISIAARWAELLLKKNIK